MSAPSPLTDAESRITLIGAGTIGLSFAALHLQSLASPSQLTIVDIRPDLEQYVLTTLPKYLGSSFHGSLSSIVLTDSIADGVRGATIVQEQGPESLAFKAATWKEVAEHAPPDALLFSSTSSIPASQQADAAALDDAAAARLVVVHPYNPPHVMPLLEVVPGARTGAATTERAVAFWRARGRDPIVIKKECVGFVANRLAFALFREAAYLVDQDIVTAEELDRVVEASMGPRWAVAGPFKSYHAGGGPGGLRGFFDHLGGAVQTFWDEMERPNVGEAWEAKAVEQTEAAYGVVDTALRDAATARVLEAVKGPGSS